MKAKKWNAKARPLIVAVALLVIASAVLNILYINTSASTYNDNTSVLTKLNISNKAPVVYDVLLTDSNKPGNLQLEQGTTHIVICNASVNDTNGFGDIATVNASIIMSDYGTADGQDNNYKYDNASCQQMRTAGKITAYYKCIFHVAFYANNATWWCNVTAIDNSAATNYSTDDNELDPLYAINLSNTEISFGELEPRNTSTDREMNVTNVGNMNLSIGIKAYGDTEGDFQAMDCSVGNISLTYERYDLDSGQAWSGMTPVTESFVSIVGLDVHHRTDDTDTDNSFNKNSTFWKIQAPESAKGVCNGTLIFSAVPN